MYPCNRNIFELHEFVSTNLSLDNVSDNCQTVDYSNPTPKTSSSYYSTTNNPIHVIASPTDIDSSSTVQQSDISPIPTRPTSKNYYVTKKSNAGSVSVDYIIAVQNKDDESKDLKERKEENKQRKHNHQLKNTTRRQEKHLQGN